MYKLLYVNIVRLVTLQKYEVSYINFKNMKFVFTTLQILCNTVVYPYVPIIS